METITAIFVAILGVHFGNIEFFVIYTLALTAIDVYKFLNEAF